MGFFKNYGKVKVTGLQQEIMKAIISVDLDGASEADLMTYEQNLDKLVAEVAKQRVVAERERKEADEIVKLYNQKIDAIQLLQADVEANPANAAEINAVIEEELAALAAMEADVEREKQEAVEAEADLAEVKSFAEEAATALKTARTTLEAAKKNLERSKRAAEREEERTRRAQELKGLTSNVGKLTTALGIMNVQAQEYSQKADAAKLKGQLLGTQDDKKSDIMKQAMERAKGVAPVAAPGNIKDRLAALQKK